MFADIAIAPSSSDSSGVSLSVAMSHMSRDSLHNEAVQRGSLAHPRDKITSISPGSLEERIHCQNCSNNLDLTACDLETIPLSLIGSHYEGCPQVLDLSFNRISQMGTTFPSTFAQLRILNLKQNRLQKLPANFGDLQALESLNLSQNQLSQLPLSMWKMDNLTSLDLSGNMFRDPVAGLLGQFEDSSPQVIANVTKAFLKEISTEGLLQRPSSQMNLPIPGCKTDKSRQTNVSTTDHQSSLEQNPGIYTTVKESFFACATYCREAVENVPAKYAAAITIIFLLLLAPTYFIQTEYLDEKAKNSPSFQTVWNGLRPAFEAGASLTAWIPKADILTLKGPPPLESEGISWNPLTHVKNYYVGFYSILLGRLGLISEESPNV